MSGRPPRTGEPCPHCGAPLPEPDPDDGVLTCTYCSTAYSPRPAPQNRPEDPPPLAITINTAPRRASGCLTAVIPVFLVVIVVGIAAAVFAINGVSKTAKRVVSAITVPRAGERTDVAQPRVDSRYPTGRSFVAVPDGGGVLFTVNRRLGLTGQTLLRIGADGVMQWESAPFEKDDHARTVALASDLVLVTDGAKLIGLDLRTGAPRWTTPLTDTVRGGCDDDCVIALPALGRVVVRTINGEVYGIDLADGRVAWTRRLANVSAAVRQVGTTIAVIDRPADGRGFEMTVLDANDGSQRQRFQPACTPGARAVFSSIQPWSPFVAVDATSFVVQLGNSDGCWQRWNVDTATIVWSHPVAGSLIGRDAGLVRDGVGRLLFGERARLGVIDIALGTTRTIDEDPDAIWRPLQLRGDVAVSLREQTRGTSRFAVVGHSISTGALMWRVELTEPQITAADDGSQTVFPNRDAAIVDARSADLLVARAKAESKLVTIERIDPTTGLTTTVAEITVDGFASAWSFGIPLAAASRRHLVVADSVVEFDLQRGASTWRWPKPLAGS